MPSSSVQKPTPSKSQACVPCARRKVRCDRREPCSNCRRRKHDRCIYVEPPSYDRIRKLEALVRSLGGDPDHEASTQEQTGPELPPSPARSRDQESLGLKDALEDLRLKRDESILTEENGEPVYLEPLECKGFAVADHERNLKGGYKRVPILASSEHNALFSVIRADESVDLSSRYPGRFVTEVLWDNFFERFHPLTKINFEWELKEIRASVLHAPTKEFTNQKHAFLFALYLNSTLTLTDDECLALLDQSRTALVSEFQYLCEQALARSNFISTTDMTCLQALTMYISAGLDRLNMKSLWSLMGLVLRIAERLGFHRDGTFLGLSPIETERRRRVWWYLQHLDVALSVGSGCSSLTMVADWDIKLPLNIEDDDIHPNMQEPPPERDGLTAMSYCIWTYWVLEEQRGFRSPNGTRLGLSWSSTRTLSPSSKEEQIEQLEKRLNKRFLQYCDPIKPLHLMLQITSRMFISMLHRMALHPQTFASPDDYEESHRRGLLDSCCKSVEYYVALNSSPALKEFQWRTKKFLPWTALVFVLFEFRDLDDNTRIEKIWKSIFDFYAVAPELLNLDNDRRNFYIAELVILAWKKHESYIFQGGRGQSLRLVETLKPSLIMDLEAKLVENGNLVTHSQEAVKYLRGREKPFSSRQENTPAESRQSQTFETQQSSLSAEGQVDSMDLEALTELKFDDIDWTLWNNFDYNSMVQI